MEPALPVLKVAVAGLKEEAEGLYDEVAGL